MSQRGGQGRGGAKLQVSLSSSQCALLFPKNALLFLELCLCFPEVFFCFPEWPFCDFSKMPYCFQRWVISFPEVLSFYLLCESFQECFSSCWLYLLPSTHGCSNHLMLDMEAECLTENLTYLNLNISRTKSGRNKL